VIVDYVCKSRAADKVSHSYSHVVVVCFIAFCLRSIRNMSFISYVDSSIE